MICTCHTTTSVLACPIHQVFATNPDARYSASAALRRRINVSRTQKGFTVDITVEGHGYSVEDLMAELEATYQAVDQRFPKEA